MGERGARSRSVVLEDDHVPSMRVGGQLPVAITPRLDHRPQISFPAFGEAKVMTRIVQHHIVATTSGHMPLEQTGVGFRYHSGGDGGELVGQNTDQTAIGKRDFEVSDLIFVSGAEWAALLIFWSARSLAMLAIGVGPFPPFTCHQDPISGGGVQA